MKIAIIGASGNVGKKLVQEAVRQGYEVTGIVRNKKHAEDLGIPIIEKDLFSLTAEDLKDFDAVLDSFRAANGQEEEHQTSIRHLIQIFESLPNTRLLIVGGAGSLYLNPEKSLQLAESEDFPEEYKPTAINMAKGLDLLRKSSIQWTYLSPAANFDFDGSRTGKYQLGQEILITNRKGESYVSTADYAIALIDEIRNQNYIQKRFTVVSEKE